MALAFPVDRFERKESPSLYGPPLYEDKSIKADTDGGYEFRRERHTRRPRMTCSTGFISMNQDDFEILDAFYLTHTNVEPFVWFDYLRGVYRTVRFDEYKPSYTGIGKNRMWNVSIKMTEL